MAWSCWQVVELLESIILFSSCGLWSALELCWAVNDWKVAYWQLVYLAVEGSREYSGFPRIAELAPPSHLRLCLWLKPMPPSLAGGTSGLGHHEGQKRWRMTATPLHAFTGKNYTRPSNCQTQDYKINTPFPLSHFCGQAIHSTTQGPTKSLFFPKKSSKGIQNRCVLWHAVHSCLLGFPLVSVVWMPG